MALTYNGFLIIPAPLVTVTKNWTNRGDGTPLNTQFDILLRGTLLPDKGSPSGDGGFATTGVPDNEETYSDADRFDAIRHKQQGIHDLFAVRGAELQWSFDGQQLVKCYPNVQSINFAEGIWVQRCDYEIRLKANRLFGPDAELTPSGEDGNQFPFEKYNLQSATENWSVQEQTDGTNTYTVTHTIQAVASENFGLDESYIAEYDPPWKAARLFCLDNIGDATSAEAALVGSSIFPNSFSSSNLQLANKVTSETFDELAGSYSITENWIVATGTTNPVSHSYTVRQQTANHTDGGVDGIGSFNTYNLAGVITGLDTPGNSDAYTNAQTFLDNSILTGGNAVNLIAGAIDGFNGTSIYDHPRSTQITRNKNQGTISYELSFTDAIQSLPSTGLQVLNNKLHSYDLVVSDTGGDVSAGVIAMNTAVAIPIPGRAKGPVIQVLGTKPVVTRTITFTANLSPAATMTDLEDIRKDTITILGADGAAVIPTGNTWLTDYRDQYNFQQGTYSATLLYMIEGTL